MPHKRMLKRPQRPQLLYKPPKCPKAAARVQCDAVIRPRRPVPARLRTSWTLCAGNRFASKQSARNARAILSSCEQLVCGVTCQMCPHRTTFIISLWPALPPSWPKWISPLSKRCPFCSAYPPSQRPPCVPKNRIAFARCYDKTVRWPHGLRSPPTCFSSTTNQCTNNQRLPQWSKKYFLPTNQPPLLAGHCKNYSSNAWRPM